MDFSFTVCSFQLGEPPVTSVFGSPACNPHGDPPVFGDCWYNCTLEDISGDDKKHRLRKVLFSYFSMIFYLSHKTAMYGGIYVMLKHVNNN